METPTVVIFHSLNGQFHCDDGFAAAWVANKYFHSKGIEAEFVPGIYGKEPPDVEGKHVVLLDFSYDYKTICNMSFEARSLLILDHHKTAQEALERLPNAEYSMDGKDNYLSFREDRMGVCLTQNIPVIGALFDMDRSGAMLSWNFFFPNEEQPALIDYVQDGDLWRWKLGFSKEFQAAVRSYPQTFNTWNHLASTPSHQLIDEGTAIRRFIDQKVQELLPNARMMEVGTFKVWGISCPKFLASDLTNALAERDPNLFAVSYEDGKEFRTWSLRSVGDFDVSRVAKWFGGGGHAKASGFQTPL